MVLQVRKYFVCEDFSVFACFLGKEGTVCVSFSRHYHCFGSSCFVTRILLLY